MSGRETNGETKRYRGLDGDKENKNSLIQGYPNLPYKDKEEEVQHVLWSRAESSQKETILSAHAEWPRKPLRIEEAIEWISIDIVN